MTKWIDIKERLPEIYDFVLVCANFQGTGEPKPIQIARIVIMENHSLQWHFLNEAPAVGAQGAWMDLYYPIDTEDITHWMPLPKPPEDL